MKKAAKRAAERRSRSLNRPGLISDPGGARAFGATARACPRLQTAPAAPIRALTGQEQLKFSEILPGHGWEGGDGGAAAVKGRRRAEGRPRWWWRRRRRPGGAPGKWDSEPHKNQ